MINLADDGSALQAWVPYPNSDEQYLLRWIQRHELTQRDANGAFVSLGDEELLEKILLDWKGVERSGQPVQCHRNERMNFFRRQDGAGVIRFSWMLAKALDINTFVNLEGTLKNLMRPSSGD